MRSPSRILLAVASCALGALMLGSTGTLSGWPAAVVANSNTTGTASLAFTHTYPSGSCTGTARMSTRTCAGSWAPQNPAPSSGTVTAVDGIANQGDLAVTQTVTGSSCGPVQFADSMTSTDPLLPRYATTFGQADPWGSSKAAAFSGSAYAGDITGASGSGLLGLLQSSYSIGVWFNASDALGGGLMGLGASLSNASSATGNPMMWLDTAGKVRFAASSTLATITGVSSGNWGSGWHLAVLTVDTSGVLTLTKTVTLYVDGSVQATASGLSLLSSTPAGYWHLGWADFTSISAGAPSSTTFHGSLAGAFVINGVTLNSTQIGTISAKALGATSYESTVKTLGATHLWMLGDSGTTTYGGTLPGGMAAPCSQVTVSLSFANPADSSISGMTLANFANNTPRTVTAPSPGQTQTLSVALARASSGYSSDVSGLRLYVPIVFTVSVSANWRLSLTWSGDPAEVFLA